MKKIIGISGSLRKQSFNTALLRAFKKQLPDDFELIIADISQFPLYNFDLQQATGLPEPVEKLKQEIAQASGVIISTPEYNHSIPGVLKNAIDWLSRPMSDIKTVFGHKKIGLIGASPSRFGTAYAQAAWLPVLACFNMHTYFEKRLFVSQAPDHFDKNLNLVDSATRDLLQDYVIGFCEFLNSN